MDSFSTFIHYSYNFELTMGLDEEKAMVEEVFGNAIASLSEDDKHLPQVWRLLADSWQ